MGHRNNTYCGSKEQNKTRGSSVKYVDDMTAAQKPRQILLCSDGPKYRFYFNPASFGFWGRNLNFIFWIFRRIFCTSDLWFLVGWSGGGGGRQQVVGVWARGLWHRHSSGTALAKQLRAEVSGARGGREAGDSNFMRLEICKTTIKIRVSNIWNPLGHLQSSCKTLKIVKIWSSSSGLKDLTSPKNFFNCGNPRCEPESPQKNWLD